jgi:hypothetical protein
LRDQKLAPRDLVALCAAALGTTGNASHDRIGDATRITPEAPGNDVDLDDRTARARLLGQHIESKSKGLRDDGGELTDAKLNGRHTSSPVQSGLVLDDAEDRLRDGELVHARRIGAGVGLVKPDEAND